MSKCGTQPGLMSSIPGGTRVGPGLLPPLGPPLRAPCPAPLLRTTMILSTNRPCPELNFLVMLPHRDPPEISHLPQPINPLDPSQPPPSSWPLVLPHDNVIIAAHLAPLSHSISLGTLISPSSTPNTSPECIIISNPHELPTNDSSYDEFNVVLSSLSQVSITSTMLSIVVDKFLQ
ncbi:hypothetical protein AMTRI_Chr09g36400 [Amborella trichopoda]